MMSGCAVAVNRLREISVALGRGGHFDVIGARLRRQLLVPFLVIKEEQLGFGLIEAAEELRQVNRAADVEAVVVIAIERRAGAPGDC